MSFIQEGSSSTVKGKKTTRARRSWTNQEEALFISSLKELISQGWKSDNGFRAGYLNKLEESMESHFSGTDLKGFPHINSKLTTWKKSYYSLTAILSRSGVGFNLNGNHKIDCEEETWEHIIKLDSHAKPMRGKEWPLFDDWKEIFGKDRATGESAQDYVEAWNELCGEDNLPGITPESPNGAAPTEVNFDDLPDNEVASENNSRTGKGPTLPSRTKASKRKSTDDLSALCEILTDFGKKTDERLASLVQSIGYDAGLGQAAEDTFDELSKIEGLSLEQRLDVCEILHANIDKVRMFRGLKGSARAQYVERLLQKYGKQ